MMRSPQEIQSKLEQEPEPYNNVLLNIGLGQDVNQIALILGDTYEKAFLNALRHRPNGEIVDKLATLMWLAGSDFKVADVPWLQFGMRRIRLMAKELNLPWIPIGDKATLLKAKRMSNGLPCSEKCVRCFQGV